MNSFPLLIVFLFLLLPGVTLAQEEVATTTDESSTPQTLVLGTETVTYTTTSSIKAGELYYQEDGTTGAPLLVASTHDTNDDEKYDLWLLYASDATVRLEAHDTDGDESPDTFISLTPQGTVSTVTGTQAETLTAPIIVPFSPQAGARNDADLVGDLSDVTINNQSPIWAFFIILFIAGAGVYFFLRRQRGE